MSWRPRRMQSPMDPAWRALGLLLLLPTAGQILSANLLYLGDPDSAAGRAWVAYQLLAVAGLVVGVRIVVDGRWRGAALGVGLAWIGAHGVYDVAFTDSFVRFGERVPVPRPWAFGEGVPIGAWIGGMAVIWAGMAAKRLAERRKPSRPGVRRFLVVGLASVLRGR